MQLRSGEENKSNQPAHRLDKAANRASSVKVLVIVGVLVAAGAIGAVGAAISGTGKVHSSDYTAAAPSTTAPASPASPASGSVEGSPALASRPAATSKPKPKASSSPSHRAQVSGANLAQLPINTELTGASARVWAEAALDALGAPKTAANMKTMVDWFANEGIPHALNNPLNLQTPMGGSTVSTDSGAPASANIQAYPTPADFVAAFPLEMNKGSYPAIVAALKSGQGLEGTTSSEIQNELLIYSGSGYDSIPADYNQH